MSSHHDIDFEPELPTSPGHKDADVNLYDANLHTMVGKMARSLVRCHVRITGLEAQISTMTRLIKRAGYTLSTIVLILQAALEAYRRLAH